MLKLSKQTTTKNNYYIDGVKIPGVTTVLDLMDKPYLIHWAVKLAKQNTMWYEVRDRRKRIGLMAHDLIDCQLSNRPCTLEGSDEEIKIAMLCKENFDKWYESQDNINILATETCLVSKEHRFGGTCDLYYEQNGKRILMDFKTSKNVYENHKIQQCAYKLLLEENGMPVDEIKLLGINEEKRATVHQIPDSGIEVRTQLFLGLLDVYNCMQELKKK